MNKYRRKFLKSLALLLLFLPICIFPSFNKESVISFKYGVASGDPTNTNVILWTKILPMGNPEIRVRWEVSSSKDFSNLITYGHVRTNSKKDYSVKVDAKIPKKFNGEKIYYRFLADGKTSDVGMTSTLPSENPNNFNIAFCSCSNYPAGYFNAYKEIAKNEKIDLVLHLGDYLYEYGHGGYASKDAEQMGRVVNPKHEMVSLDDYRKRYATYRSDPDLKLLHQKKPMISVWDDHEFTNDSWQKGAQNHSKDEGTFANRKKSALQAYYEWMPIREKGRKDKIWRNFRVGNLINLMMLDTRSYERDKQLDIEKYFDGNSFNKNSYLKDINKPRKLLGKEQFNWIRTKVDSSFKWSIFGQQILIGPKYLPTIFKTVDKENFPKFLHKYLSLAGTEIPYNTDQWDGYPKEREKFYKTISNSQSNLILAGDSHNSWLSNLFDKNNKFVGVEIGAPSITSPNFVDTFGDFTEALDKSFIDSNKDLIWTNGRNKGYVELNIFSEYVDVKFNFVSSVKSKNYKNLKPITFKVNHSEAIS